MFLNTNDIEQFRIEGNNFVFIIESKHEFNFSMRFHQHDFYEFSMVVGGSGIVQNYVGGETEDIPVSKNTILLRDGNTPHRAIDNTGDPLEQIIIIFDKLYLSKMKDLNILLDQLKKNNPLVIRNPLYSPQIIPLVREILHEMKTRSIGRDTVVFSALTKILIQLIRIVLGSSHLESHSEDDRIERALSYIKENFYQLIKIEDAANVSALSIRQFSNLFKKTTDQTFVQYLHSFRIEKAKDALKNSERSITDIAFEVGYDDVSYFTKKFKSLENITPREFRKSFVQRHDF